MTTVPVLVDDINVAIEVAVFHGRAFSRDQDDRHLDVIEEIHQQVRSPATFLTQTIKRLGRQNALNAGFKLDLINTCIRLAA